MKRQFLSEILLYRYRYIFGYLIYALLLVAILTLRIDTVPNGLTSSEMISATASAVSSVNGIPFHNAVDAPYMLLQKLSLHFLGLTPFAMKLPTIAVALITGLTLAFMLRRWFRLNVAVLTGILTTTSAAFLVMSRTGTPDIMPMFWIVLILLSGSSMMKASKQSIIWKIVCFVSVALSLYTPLMIYPLLAFAIAGLLHPHVRFILQRTSILKFIVAIVIGLLLITPLAWSILQAPHTLKILLGIPESLPTMSGLLQNIETVLRGLFDFRVAYSENIARPLFGAASVAIAILGLMKVFIDRHAARSYLLIIWLLAITPIIILRPENMFLYTTPIIFLLAIGIETLIREWYKLFPRNPYARIVALIPLTILLGSIATSDIARYFYGYIYTPQPGVFHQELPALRTVLNEKQNMSKNINVVVSQKEQPFYDLLRRNYKNISVSTAPENNKDLYIVLDNATSELPDSQLKQIVTGPLTANSVLLRTYSR